MFDKITAGVKVFLEKAFGKKPNIETKESIIEIDNEESKDAHNNLNDIIEDLSQERKERIVRVYDGLKDTVKALDSKMHMSKKGLADIVLSEGIILTVYKDSANVRTIGIGATRSEIENLRTWPKDRQLSLEEAFELFTTGIEKYSTGVRKALKVEVSQHMFDGLVSFAYNVGVGGMRKSSLVRAINRGVTSKRELKSYLMRWNKITVSGRKVLSKGLINRRNAEASVMFNNRYKNKKMIGRIIPVNSKLRPIYRSKRVKTIDLNKYL